ncbi:uncharacterized protein LOC130648935 [Hydractinia symbiolongicarpus]|uniref:uncharacterized protein LOC130648935 n=1 Tax=Hydractinia symbiolongicarpus TaxID=13093 RepID=UPI00254EC8CA|nr:uncharacterized protein LOC130648935 [Hydractinia symbiolongicarpus]
MFILQVHIFLSDNTLESILGFSKLICLLLNKMFGLHILDEILERFPNSLYMARQYLALNRDSFTKFVVCTSCQSLYSYNQCWKKEITGRKTSSKCSHVKFPNHPFPAYREPCNNILMKVVVSFEKNINLYPKKVYAYRSIKTGLEELLARPGFLELLFTKPDEHVKMSDIFDGQIWKSFQDSIGELYFADKRNLGVMLNLDWFNPYKNREHSVGVIYLSILNLPRQHRLLWKNTLIIGIIPGPKEPNLHINSFIKPMVDELLQYWDGVIMKEPSSIGYSLYKIALISISNDIPATRKFGGFLNFNAKSGCSKCLKVFNKVGDFTDYSGSDVDAWELRTGINHKRYALHAANANTKSECEKRQREHGARYSELHRLPYYDPVRMHTIDPMHNLYLGTAKHVFKTWIEIGVLTSDKLKCIDDKMKKVKVPTDVGRIPGNMSDCYKSMKADEWRHWTHIYSCFCLKDVIPDNHLNMWLIFVAACNKICTRSITAGDIYQAHTLFCMFIGIFANLCGKLWCTPNMHLHLHLKDCLLDYGPVYAFWCFSYERFNGILGSYHVNNHDITIQLMRKFIIGCQVRAFNLLEDDFTDMLKLSSDKETVHSQESLLKLQKVRDSDKVVGTELEFTGCEEKLSKATQFSLPGHQIDELTKLFSSLYRHMDIKRVSRFIVQIKRVMLGNEVICSKHYIRSNGHGSFLKARYNHGDYFDFEPKELRPAVVNGIYEIKVVFSDRVVNHIVVDVSWFKKHVQYNFFGVNSPMKVWCTEIDKRSLIPLKFVHGRILVLKEQIRISKQHVDIVKVCISLPSKSL